MKLRVANLEIEVREGTVDDVPLLLSFIRSMAKFEKLEVTATEELLREELFGKSPAAHTLLAFVDGRPAAYGVFFYSFSTMVGKRCLWLEDLYVSPDFREKGIARALMAYLADLAIKEKCARIEWVVLDWNMSAIDFYRGLGATVQKDWRNCRLEEENFSILAEQLVRVEDQG